VLSVTSTPNALWIVGGVMWVLVLFVSVWWCRFLLLYAVTLRKNEFSRQEELCQQQNLLLEQLLAQKKSLEGRALMIQEIFDLTKDMCGFLDLNELLQYYREQLKKHLGITQCDFVLTPTEILGQGQHIIPMYLDNGYIGSLVTEPSPAAGGETFAILSRQFSLSVKRVVLYQRVQELAITDSLTGLFTRRYFLERASEEISRANRLSVPVSILMVDIDRFKETNDHFGHLVGDALLKETGRILKENARQMDLIGRLGGDEFVVLLGESDSEKAQKAAERMLKTLSKAQIHAYDEWLSLNVSIGVAVSDTASLSLPALIERADQALYRAKNSGRNCISS